MPLKLKLKRKKEKKGELLIWTDVGINYVYLISNTAIKLAKCCFMRLTYQTASATQI